MTRSSSNTSSQTDPAKAGFSIVLPTYNRADLLRASLESVLNLVIPDSWGAEVLVVDNNSADHTADVVQELARRGPLPIRRCVEKKQGASHSRNRAIVEAQFEHLVYLDDDMLVDSGWLEAYLDAQRSHRPDLVVGPVEPWFEEPPSDLMTQQMLDSLTSAYSRKGSQLIELPPNQGMEVPGCNFAVLRSAAVEAGGFDTRIDRCAGAMLGGGDWELGEKLVLLGKKVVYAPNCRIRHFISRKKMSRPEMRARWAGIGASQRALMRLRGEEPQLQRKLRLFLRMNRFIFRSIRSRLAHDARVAYQWELEALKLRGFLFQCPQSVQPRRWPPVPLSDSSEKPA